MDDPCVKQEVVEEPVPEPRENVKTRRRKRGKRRIHRHALVGGEDEMERLDHDDSSGENGLIERKKFKKVLIRPVDAPKAPENTSQFIIDDHDECHLYFNFESPYPHQQSTRTEAEADGDEAALEDIDYQYESMQDLDNSAYYIRDFELSYSNMRYEELLHLSRTELIKSIEKLETRLKELDYEYIECDPNSALEQLQQKLLQLQEESTSLKESNMSLRKMLTENNAGASASSAHNKDIGDGQGQLLSNEHEEEDESSQEDVTGLINTNCYYECDDSNCDEEQSYSDSGSESDLEDSRQCSSDYPEGLCNKHLAVTYDSSEGSPEHENVTIREMACNSDSESFQAAVDHLVIDNQKQLPCNNDTQTSVDMEENL